MEHTNAYLPKYSLLSSILHPEQKRVYWEAFVNYSRQFAEKHNVSGLILYNYNSHQAPGDGEYGGLPQVYQGLVARANYDFEGKYLVEINLGYNGSNRFVEGERYALFLPHP